MKPASLLIALALAGGASAAGQRPEGSAERGKTMYVKTGCAACHGLEGQGAPTSGPRLAPNPLPREAFIQYVRAPRNQMPPYTSKVISDAELDDVRAFLAERPKPAPASVLAP